MGRMPSNRSAVERQKMKVESRKRHQRDLRRAMAVSDYLLLTATDMHRQATEFVNKLEEKYPTKRDVRKTVEFRNWQQNQLFQNNKQSLATDQTTVQVSNNCQKEMVFQNNKQSLATDQTTVQVSNNCQKEMVLRIPLLQSTTNAKETPPVPDMSGETQDLLPSIFDQIPDDVMNELMAEIRADPELDAIMNDFGLNEEVLEEGTVPENIHQELDVGLNIEIDDPFEDEINRLLLYF